MVPWPDRYGVWYLARTYNSYQGNPTCTPAADITGGGILFRARNVTVAVRGSEVSGPALKTTGQQTIGNNTQ